MKSLFLLLVILFIAAPRGVAYAACTPTVTHLDPATTSAKVSWLETCPAPGRIQLLQNGTAPNFQNGKLLGDENPTGAQNAGVVTSNMTTLAPGTTYDNVRLCAVYFPTSGAQIYCTNPFAFKTLAAAPPVVTTLQITSTSSTPYSVTFGWSTPSQFQSYHVRLDGGNEQTVQAGSQFTYAYPALTPSTRYDVSVEGCKFVGISGNSCSNNWVNAAVTTQAAPPVTTKTYSLKPFGAGDCLMQNASVAFRSDGTFQFNAQVLTKHTTTSDYWHVKLDLLNNSGVVLDTVPEFTGPAMKDAHPGWYDWSHSGYYAPGDYPGLSSLNMPGRC